MQGRKGWMAGSCLAAILLLAGGGEAFAGMVGAPDGKLEPDLVDKVYKSDRSRLRSSVEADWMLDRNLSLPGRRDASVDFSQAYRAHLGYRVWEPLEIYGLFGAADLKLQAADAARVPFTEEFGLGFQYGGGLQLHLELPEDGFNLRFSADGQFTQWMSDLNQYSDASLGTFTRTTGQARVRAFHGALTAGRQFDWSSVLDSTAFIPYVGGRWSQWSVKENDLDTDRTAGDDLADKKWKARDHIGVIAGFSVQVGSHWQATVEGHLVDETAVSASGSFRF